MTDGTDENYTDELHIVRSETDGTVLLSNGSSLTSRELEVLSQMAHGKSNPEVAEALFLSVHTVEFHATRIYQKLRVRNRLQATLAAKRIGLVPDPACEPSALTSRAVQDASSSPEAVASEKKPARWRWPLTTTVGGLAAVVLAVVATVGLLTGLTPAGDGGTGDAQEGFIGLRDVGAAGPRAHELAMQLVPDAALNQVALDPVTGSTVFSFVSPDALTQVDVLVPQPKAPPDDWQATQDSPSIEKPMLGRQLDLSSVTVAARSAWDAVTAEFECSPVSLMLVPLGIEPAGRQTWLVACNFADGRRVLALVDGQSGRLEVPGAPMDPARVRALAGGPQPVDGPSVQPLDTAPDWSKAEFITRDGRILTLRLPRSGEMIDVDLSQVGVFDCRLECYVNIGARLGGLAAEDDICIGWLGVRDGHQDGMLWVNRYTCEAGGRVIPP